ncbi:MAG: hypothetical protein HQM03_01450 [Magnetococcales bacterium]|nr:hypothetical protein [Magnetococcales bacterium]
MADPVTPSMSEALALVEEAEALAGSEDWLGTARRMRRLLARWRTLEAAHPSLCSGEPAARFRAAQQMFMERRATYYQQGNARKGEGLQRRLERMQEEIVVLEREILRHARAERECEERLRVCAGREHEGEIRAFLLEALRSLREETGRKEAALRRLEQSVGGLAARYHGIE